MTDQNTKKYIEEENNPQAYSINFLMAEFEEIKNLDRDEKVLQTFTRSSHYGNNNFSTDMYYKNISALSYSLQDDNDK